MEIIKSGMHGTETVVCDREGEEEAGTKKQCMWKGYINRTEWGLAGQAKEDNVL